MVTIFLDASYFCSCIIADIDECSLNQGNCSPNECVNAPGSFNCVCRNGHILAQDGTCIGEPKFCPVHILLKVRIAN